MAKLADKKAINKWIFFTFNYPYNIIEKVWADNPSLAMHLRSKLNSKFNGNMNMLYCELDRENADKLLTWVLENYNDERKYIEPCSEE